MTDLTDRLPHASAATRALNRDMFADVPAQFIPDPPPANEAELQDRCEKWLDAKGYGRRVPKRMQKHSTGKWQAHVNEAKRNPIMADLTLIDSNRGACLEVELKVKGGKLSPDQQAMAFRGEWAVCWSVDEFVEVVEGWEGKV